jgi:hypothetical protein
MACNDLTRSFCLAIMHSLLQTARATNDERDILSQLNKTEHCVYFHKVSLV